MNKKGFLLGEETLKIIIAVICIGLLIYLLFALYFSNQDQKKKVDAYLTLLNSTESIKVVIERVLVGNGVDGGNMENKMIHNPRGWNLMSFTGGSAKPNSCLGKNCFCICDEVWIDTLFGLMDSRQLKECDEKGACLGADYFAEQKLNIEIEEDTNLNILNDGGLIRITKNGS